MEKIIVDVQEKIIFEQLRIKQAMMDFQNNYDVIQLTNQISSFENKRSAVICASKDLNGIITRQREDCAIFEAKCPTIKNIQLHQESLSAQMKKVDECLSKLLDDQKKKIIDLKEQKAINADLFQKLELKDSELTASKQVRNSTIEIFEALQVNLNSLQNQLNQLTSEFETKYTGIQNVIDESECLAQSLFTEIDTIVKKNSDMTKLLNLQTENVGDLQTCIQILQSELKEFGERKCAILVEVLCAKEQKDLLHRSICSVLNEKDAFEMKTSNYIQTELQNSNLASLEEQLLKLGNRLHVIGNLCDQVKIDVSNRFY